MHANKEICFLFSSLEQNVSKMHHFRTKFYVHGLTSSVIKFIPGVTAVSIWMFIIASGDRRTKTINLLIEFRTMVRLYNARKVPGNGPTSAANGSVQANRLKL
jgi:hypothetical protein